MKKYVSFLLVAILALCVVAAHSPKAQDLHPSPADSMVSETMCMYNHTTGVVYDCDGNPDPGVTVTLTCPDGSTERRVTDSDGEYCFARPISVTGEPSWEPGLYGLTAGCLGRLVYREGNGDIEVDLSTCCPE